MADQLDILAWSEEQAKLLRARAADKLDFKNLAEEIEDLGRSELHACQALLTQAMRHMLKARAWPQSLDAPSWRADAVDFLQQARRKFTPSMRPRIDIDVLYADAVTALPTMIDGCKPSGLILETCPWTLDWFLVSKK
jgi:hypothetical protein